MSLDLPSIFPGNHRAAVSLTYDDALDVHLDHAMPDLEAAELRGTFYIPTRRENAWRTRPDEWKAAHGRGHEIANHTQYHPCSGKHPWVLPNFRLEAYSLSRIESELLGAATDIGEVLGPASSDTSATSFAYPCGESMVGPEETSFRPMIERLFPAGRGVIRRRQLVNPFECDFSYVPGWALSEQMHAEDLIDFLNDAIEHERWAVVIFHGVGGGHEINVTRDTHRAICRHLAIHREEIWCDTFLNVARHVRDKVGKPWTAPGSK